MDNKVSKELFSKRVGESKALHAEWMSKVELVVKGVYKVEDLTPVPYTQSGVGKIFQAVSGKYHDLPSFKAIITPLETLHNMYVEIYQGLTSKKPMFTNQKKWDQLQVEKSCDTFNKMKEVSNTLYKNADKFIEEFNSL